MLNKTPVSISGEYLKDLYERGLTVKEMRQAITQKYSADISDANIKRLYKSLNLDLRRKPQPSKFILEEMTNTVVNEQAVVNE
jgi:hypothetical protein